jgi:hypothetical protein
MPAGLMTPRFGVSLDPVMSRVLAASILLLLLLPASAQDAPKDPLAVLQAIGSWAKKHPNDLVGLREKYLDARDSMARDTEPRRFAERRIAELDEKVPSAYRKLRPTTGTPPTLDEKEKRKVALVISRDLKNRDRDVRSRSIGYLTRLANDAAAPRLVAQLIVEKDASVRKEIGVALEAIGGPEVCDLLARKAPRGKAEARSIALSVLEVLIRESDEEEDRKASFALGTFVYSKDAETAERALVILEKAGPRGVYGLVRAVGIGDHQLKLRIIRDLGKTGEGRAAAALGMFLDFGAKGRQAEYKVAASDSIEKLGILAVPWMIRFLDDPNFRQRTKYLLYRITGQSFERPDEVRTWLGKHRAELERKKRKPARTK